MKREIGRREADADAVFGDDKAGCPAQRRAGAAQRADQDAGKPRNLRLMFPSKAASFEKLAAQVTCRRLIL